MQLSIATDLPPHERYRLNQRYIVLRVECQLRLAQYPKLDSRLRPESLTTRGRGCALLAHQKGPGQAKPP